MKKIFVLISYISMCVCTNNTIHAQWPSNPSGKFWSQSKSKNTYVTELETAIALSKETKQKVILIFSADWCINCKNLKQDFPDIEEFDNKIVCILDSDKEKKILKQFRVKNLPTSIILDGDSKELGRIVGYQKHQYKQWLKSK